MKAYALGLYEKAMPPNLPWEVMLSAAKEAGYDFVEMSIDATEEKIARLEMSPGERLALVEKLYEAGIPLGSMCVSALTKYSLGNPDPAYRARGVEIGCKSIRLAADLGIRVVMIPGYDVFYEPSDWETKRLFRENLAPIVEAAARTGVLVGFETMENAFMNTVEKAMKYVALMDSGYLQVYPDIGNLTNAAWLYKTDVAEDMALGRGNLVALHLKETLPGRFREVPYGAGHVDFAAAIRTAWSLGVRRYVTEFWYDGGEDWQGALHRTYDRFAPLLDAAAKM